MCCCLLSPCLTWIDVNVQIYKCASLLVCELGNVYFPPPPLFFFFLSFFSVCFLSLHFGVGAVNINFTVMTKRRFMSGKITLSDLVTTEEGREKFKVREIVLFVRCFLTRLHIFVSKNCSR